MPSYSEEAAGAGMRKSSSEGLLQRGSTQALKKQREKAKRDKQAR